MLKEKIKNLLLKNGKKHTSEKIFKEITKKIQKEFKKQSNLLLKISILNLTPLFKIHSFEQKRKKTKQIKEIPTFITNNDSRVSSAIKTILNVIKKRGKIVKMFKNEIVLGSKNTGDIILAKKRSQETAISKKHLLENYKW